MVPKHLVGPRPHGPRLEGAIALAKGLLATLIVGALSGSAWAWQEPFVHLVHRGEFIHDVLERGTVESAETVELRCEVPSQETGGTRILRIVPEGTLVKEGDLLVELDASALKEEQLKQQIACFASDAAVTLAGSRRAIAEMARKEYLEGLYKLEEMSIQREILLAEATLSQAQEAIQQSQALAEKGYATKQQSEAGELRLKKARTDLELAKLKLEVLQKYTKPKMASQLELEIITHKAALQAAEHTHRLNLDKLARIKAQVDKCTIKAPAAGQVLYANVRAFPPGTAVVIKEGTRVRQRQLLLRLMDPKRMQVQVTFGEVNVARAKSGMPATICVDAFPEQLFKGVVETVAEHPAPASPGRPGGKVYLATVRIDESPPILRVGMTAEVTIRVEHQRDVLLVPVQAVIQHGKKHYCLLYREGAFESLEVTVGSTNDKDVVIRSGLKEGDPVVLGAARYRDQLDLPKLPPGEE